MKSVTIYFNDGKSEFLKSKKNKTIFDFLDINKNGPEIIKNISFYNEGNSKNKYKFNEKKKLWELK